MKFDVVRLKFVCCLCWQSYVMKIYKLRWRNCRVRWLRHEGVQDRALELCAVLGLLLNENLYLMKKRLPSTESVKWFSVEVWPSGVSSLGGCQNRKIQFCHELLEKWRGKRKKRVPYDPYLLKNEFSKRKFFCWYRAYRLQGLLILRGFGYTRLRKR